jgi:regulator of sirC expression with transglutaminase-like and TPR domain
LELDTGPMIFAHVVDRPDEEIDLAAAALLIAARGRPGVDVAHYLALLDRLADEVRGRGETDRLAALRRHLAGELGFRGNTEDYYDPRNSFLDCVIDRRLGIPITLSVVVMEVGRRVGLDLRGIGFPGHFLVLAQAGAGGVYLDPFDGCVELTRHDLEERLRAIHGPSARLADPMLAETSKRAILARMLNNLRAIYQTRGDRENELGVNELLAALDAGAHRRGTTN